MTLPTAAWLMAEFVACLEDDRDSAVIEANRGDLWRPLDRHGDPPESDHCGRRWPLPR